MTLSELKEQLHLLDNLTFELPDGKEVPSHFHLTELGLNEKSFIDCGGTIRKQRTARLQLWSSIDYDHRLKADNLLKIVKQVEQTIGIDDLEVEVEYQGQNTLEIYGLGMKENKFLLEKKYTDCLAKDNCGITPVKQKLKLSELTNSCCQGNAC